jgi:hypothetical protein
VRPGGRSQVFLQGFPGAETSELACAYIWAKDPKVSAPANAGVKSCVWPPVLPVNFISSNCETRWPLSTISPRLSRSWNFGIALRIYMSKGSQSCL